MTSARAGLLTIEPGDFAMVIVRERLELDNMHVGRFGLRSKFARKGLLATTGPQIDPGYHGRLTLGLTNLTPKAITLSYEEDLCSVEFHKLGVPAKPYSGPFQDRDRLAPDDIALVTEGTGLAYSEVLETLSVVARNVAGLSDSVSNLHKDVAALFASLRAQRWLMPLMFVATAILLLVFGLSN